MLRSPEGIWATLHRNLWWNKERRLGHLSATPDLSVASPKNLNLSTFFHLYCHHWGPNVIVFHMNYNSPLIGLPELTCQTAHMIISAIYFFHLHCFNIFHWLSKTFGIISLACVIPLPCRIIFSTLTSSNSCNLPVPSDLSSLVLSNDAHSQPNSYVVPSCRIQEVWTPSFISCHFLCLL